MRPTKQRLAISKILFNRKETFHFTIDQLKKIIEKNFKKKISLATLYNTIHAFKKKGYLKEISITSEKSYFDTNVNNHHHFFDVKENKLIDIEANQVELKNIPSPPNGKTIKNVNVVINVENDSQ